MNFALELTVIANSELRYIQRNSDQDTDGQNQQGPPLNFGFIGFQRNRTMGSVRFHVLSLTSEPCPLPKRYEAFSHSHSELPPNDLQYTEVHCVKMTKDEKMECT